MFICTTTIFSAQAYNDLIGKYGWDAVTILYENNESMSRLKEVFDRTATVGVFLYFNTFTNSQI